MELNKARNRIDMRSYSFHEYALYFFQFDNKILCIETVDKMLQIKISTTQLPHLIGLQYAYDKQRHKSKYKGKNGFQILLNNEIDLDMFENRIRRNRPTANHKRITWDMILSRIEWLPYFFNNISKKPRMKENREERLINSSLKGDYFYFKVNSNEYLILSLLKIGEKYTLESFIVYNDIRYLGDLNEVCIKNVYWK